MNVYSKENNKIIANVKSAILGEQFKVIKA